MKERSDFTNDTIIWSADVPRLDIAAVINAKALPEGTVIKLDRYFFETEDKSFIDWCQSRGYPVFCDAKIIEIPVKAIAIAETYLKYSPFMLNIMANAASSSVFDYNADENQMDALKRFEIACRIANTRSCIVTVLTSKTEKTCLYEYEENSIKQVLKYVDLAHQAGITDIVCSPKEAAAIRKVSKYNDMWINTPGVRLPNSSKDDQARVTTPREALNNGANRLVIGRDLIRGQGSVVERVQRNYEKILENINS